MIKYYNYYKESLTKTRKHNHYLLNDISYYNEFSRCKTQVYDGIDGNNLKTVVFQLLEELAKEKSDLSKLKRQFLRHFNFHINSSDNLDMLKMVCGKINKDLINLCENDIQITKIQYHQRQYSHFECEVGLIIQSGEPLHCTVMLRKSHHYWLFNGLKITNSNNAFSVKGYRLTKK